MVFRGSESINNWITDLDVITSPFPYCSDCNVHEGFYEAEKSIIPEVIKEVKRLQEQFPSHNVVLTGHSLGAALATLSAIDLVNGNVTRVRLFNFGSPRIGDEKFSGLKSIYFNFQIIHKI